MKSLAFVLMSVIAVFGASTASAAPILFQASAANVAGITLARDAYRAALGGGTVAGANGSFGGVRREINWDGVPDMFSAPNLLPPNFFNVNSPRGVVFSTPGTGFQVSATAGVAPIQFDNINPTYSSIFEPFSPQRLFTPLGSTITDVSFFLPGTTTAAVTSGFGAIFSDVDLPGSSIQYFDAFGVSLGTFVVPTLLGGNETFSFLGVVFDSAIVSRVRITSGTTALGAGINDGAQVDLAVMDDFLYAEPQTPVPEPATLLLFGAGAIVLARKRLRAKRR